MNLCIRTRQYLIYKRAGLFSDVPGQKTGKKETGLFVKTRFPEKIA